MGGVCSHFANQHNSIGKARAQDKPHAGRAQPSLDPGPFQRAVTSNGSERTGIMGADD